MSEAGWNMPMGCSGSDPYFNQPDPPECPKCHVELDEDWRYCPYCGSEIDWVKLNGEVWL